MKVLLVNKFHYKKGGSETYYFALAEALKANGHEVVFFSMKDEKNETCNQQGFFVSNSSYNGGLKQKIKMLTNLTYSKETYKKLCFLIEKEKPDLAILNLVHRQLTLSVIDALKKYDVKIFWTMHDLITVCPNYTMLDNNGNICEKCLDGNYKHCLKEKCIKGSKLMSYLGMKEANTIKKKKWYDNVDLYICPSNFYKNKLLLANFTKSQIVCMRNLLPLDTKYELNDEDKGYVLYFGRLSKEKGVKILIDVIKNIDYKLIVLGTGPIEKELKDYVISNKINNIEFLGFKKDEELTDFIRKARCVVLPSTWYENGPYSAMEAMALGKPLIVSNNGGLPELVENGKNGYVYSTKEELTECVNKIINLDKENYKNMCEESLKRAKEKFNPNTYVKNIEKLYKGNMQYEEICE